MCRRLTSTTPPSPRANDDADPKLPIEKKSLWDDKELIRQLSILTGSQLILNLGYAQLVPVMPLFAAECVDAPA